MTDYIACGWYTPDYRHWWDALRSSLERFGIQHDFVEVPKAEGGWEFNTMRKAYEVKRAMDRHPDKTIVFLDVDCEVRGPLDELVDTTADVRLYVRVKRRKSGEIKWGNIRSGTMVFRPTAGARALVDSWVRESEAGHYGDVDQGSLALAFSKAVSTTYAPMPLAYIATVGDRHPAPVILHDSASKDVTKIGKVGRFIHKMLSRGQSAPTHPSA
jgi:hypothetical protein